MNQQGINQFQSAMFALSPTPSLTPVKPYEKDELTFQQIAQNPIPDSKRTNVYIGQQSGGFAMTDPYSSSDVKRLYKEPAAYGRDVQSYFRHGTNF